MNDYRAGCRNVAPADVPLHIIRATDVLHEQKHGPLQVEWPDGQQPPLLEIAALEMISQPTRNDVKLYDVSTLAQATDRAIRGGDLGYVCSQSPDPRAAQAVRMVVRAWALYPRGPDDLRRCLEDPIDAYKALGTDFPPAVIRRAYERGYFRAPHGASRGWHHRRVFTPLIDSPGFSKRDKESMQAVVDGQVAAETEFGDANQRARLHKVYDRLGLETTRRSKASLAVALGIALHEIDPPDFDRTRVRVPSVGELDAISYAAAGHDTVGIANALQVSPPTADGLMSSGRRKLRVHRMPAAVARLFAMGIFVVGRR